MKWFAALALPVVQFSLSAAFGQSPFPLQLPGFHLTLREDPQSTLPLGPSCGGEAGLTLTCRAFVLTLENASPRTIYLNNQGENLIWIYKKEPRASGGWWPVSRLIQPRWEPVTSVARYRLMPGEHVEYGMRLIGPGRTAESFAPGPHTLRAGWDFQACSSDGPDCLATTDAIRPNALVVAGAVSNEVTADSPRLPDLGVMKFSFEVAIRSGLPAKISPSTVGCAVATSASIDCAVFRYTIRNLGDRPVRNGTMTCSDSGITPEYQTDGGEWRPIRQIGWACLGNFYFETKVFSGDTAEGEFTLANLLPGYDTSPLRAPGEYRLRFTFWPSACIASPDASFCLMRPDKQLPVVSNEVRVRVGP
ncbi:MAG: hypothetical protein WA741_05120 [Candidatus Sulfotelmatobacter sp.]